MLCVSSPGTATITRVAIHGLKGELRVDAFAVRSKVDHHDSIGGVRRSLASIGDGFTLTGPQVVASRCPSGEGTPSWSSFVELAIQLTRISGDVAGGPSLDVTYEAGGATGTLSVPLAVYVCSSTCQPPPGGWFGGS
jgi:hypothetical protein